MKSKIKDYDAIIVGGGMVGAAAALGLAQAGWHVAVIEHEHPEPFVPNSAPDIRISAIGCTSVNLLRRLGAWQDTAKMRVAPYRKLETWEWNESKVVFDAESLSLPELGFMVENRLLQLGLWQQFPQYTSLHLYCPSQLVSMTRSTQQAHQWELILNSGEHLRSPLVIGADGANSMVRKFAGIGVTGWQYRQSCMLITVETEQPQQDATWQQFYPSGPRAFLPLFDQYASLVWYDSPARIRQLQAMTLAELQKEVLQAFPERLGQVTVKAAASFPLVRRHAQQYFKSGVVLIGDAAHTINPLAGQGVNLGYRDVDTLLNVLLAARKKGEDYAQDAVLGRYQCRRYPDNQLMQAGMDIFYSAFSNQLPPLRLLRNVALMAAQRSGKIKEWALKYALGL
ncbi:3-demethoxyubiquinol 3-hydroxylase [Pragia fontium]|uniref:2-octaprenyl-3-methyl-6-methoxy-1,4-benzoquinol hydroxylase n=1 Tax=Pragia fontium DSM 5563 = ATCC 49100 TaxID=1122977 RepID=A0AAJ4W8Y2_9GAMM|nr:3-demethoxyubiquinol 3-hydroxylase [Pragia fontium]SFC38923.1 2-octaprenyl-3-methyl-6-methoxy-1,4-benzoquinol hydroxylase [Pragia fontium DSM 5563 = ATCC 49100]